MIHIFKKKMFTCKPESHLLWENSLRREYNIHVQCANSMRWDDHISTLRKMNNPSNSVKRRLKSTKQGIQEDFQFQ